MEIPVNGFGPEEFVTFRIGGRDMKVGALTLWDLEASRDDIMSMGPETPWMQYAAMVVRIIARKLKPEVWESYCEGLLKSCSGAEARNLVVPFGELLRVSGIVGEPQAAEETAEVPFGTGTLIESPQNLQ